MVGQMKSLYPTPGGEHGQRDARLASDGTTNPLPLLKRSGCTVEDIVDICSLSRHETRHWDGSRRAL